MDAMMHEERHFVSNLLGTPQMSVELSAPVEMARYDTLLLASDGLFDNLTIDEIIECIRCGPLAQRAARLKTQVEQRMANPDSGLPSKADDLTFLAYRRSR